MSRWCWGTYPVAADEKVTCVAEEGQCFDGNRLTNSFDQVVQPLSKLSRPFMNCATLIVVYEFLLITRSLANLGPGGREGGGQYHKKR